MQHSQDLPASIERLARSALALLEGARVAASAVQAEIIAARDGTRRALAGGVGAVEASATPASDRYLAPSLAAGRAGPAADLAAAIGEAQAGLRWYYGYPPLDGQPDLPQKIAFCEFLGPTAPIRSDTMRLGLTLIGPHTHYPVHAHPAVELYYVIAGTARWITPSADAQRPPGNFILHRASEPHAMETGADSLLSLYAWSGEIMAPSCYTTL